MKTTRHFGSSAVRTGSQVSKSISIREATGKQRIVGAGRDVLTYFDLGVDYNVP